MPSKARLAALALETLGIGLATLAATLGLYMELRVRLALWRLAARVRLRRRLEGKLPEPLLEEIVREYEEVIGNLRIPGVLDALRILGGRWARVGEIVEGILDSIKYIK